MKPTLITKDDVLAERARFERRERWWAANRAGLTRRFPDQWIAVREGEVVTASPDLEEFLSALRALELSPRDDVETEFLNTQADRLLL